MDAKIEEALSNPPTGSQEELKKYMQETRALIDVWEEQAYIEGRDESEVAEKVRIWRRRLLSIIRRHRAAPDVSAGSREGIETLKMMNRQLDLAEANQETLSRGTLKLVGLDFSCTDIEKAILETRVKLESGKNVERTEKRNLFIAFVILVAVCFFILGDKIRSRFVVT